MFTEIRETFSKTDDKDSSYSFSLTLTDFCVNYEKTEEDSSNIDISLKER